MNRRWSSIPLTIAVLAGGLALVVAAPAQAVGTTIVVTSTADSGVGTLREAITTAQTTADDDTITFDPTVFAAGSLHTITLASTLPNISKPLTIIGPGQDVLAISGDGLYRILFVDQGTNVAPGVSVRISDLTLTRGYNVGTGGAMYLQRAQVTLTRVKVTLSQAGQGGGAYVHSAGLTAIDSVFEDDTATSRGGAIRSDYASLGEPYAFVDLQNSIIRRNVAGHGGGIYAARRFAATNSLITQNSTTAASGEGGGLWLGYAFQHQLTGSTITNNTAYLGGGVVAGGAGWYKGQLTMQDDTVTGNSATSGDGSGGIWIGSSILKLLNSRVSNGAQGNCLPKWATAGATVWYSNIIDTTGSTVSDGSCSQLDSAVLLTSWSASSGAGATSLVQAISDPPFSVGDKVYMCSPNSCNTSNIRTGTVSDVSLADDTFAVTADAAFLASSISTGAYGAVWSPRPKILSMSPATGPAAGGTSVTITGAGFGNPGASPTPTVSATFDGQAASVVSYVDDTTVVVATPAGAAGAVAVGVTSNAYALSATSNTKPLAFTYVGAPPTITGISPSTGSAAGGDTVVISGSAFTGATAVRFGASTASFAVNSATQITATTPAGSIGTVDVVVTTPSGDDTEVGAFTYANVTPAPPPAPDPPSAPAEVLAVAGDAVATVSWSTPASSGSFPVSHYRVVSSPGGRACLTTGLACTVGGLTNGMSYTFTVSALSGAGWSAPSSPSNAVTPEGVVEPSIVITGTRTRKQATIAGSATGLPAGVLLQPWTRVALARSFTQSPAPVPLSAGGTFTWKRRLPAHADLEVYFTAGAARSNALILVAP